MSDRSALRAVVVVGSLLTALALAYGSVDLLGKAIDTYIKWEEFRGRCVWGRVVERKLREPAPPLTRFYRTGHRAGAEK